MASGLFAKIAKGVLIAGGSVLSIIPAIGPAIGAPLIVAGSQINTKSKNNTQDQVSQAASTLNETLGRAAAMNTVNEYRDQGTINGQPAGVFPINMNMLLIIIAVVGGAILLLRRR